MTMSGQEIYENFANAPGTAALEEARAQLQTIRDKFENLGVEIKQEAASWEDGWTGDAAGAAQRGTEPLAVEHARMADALGTVDGLIGTQIEGFHQVKNNVVPVPPTPNAATTVATIFSIGGAAADYEKQVNAANAAATTNVNAMSEWTTTSVTTGAGMPSSYGALSPSSIPIAQGAAPSAPGPTARSHVGSARKKSAGGSKPGGTVNVNNDAVQHGPQPSPSSQPLTAVPGVHAGSAGAGDIHGTSNTSGTVPSSETTPGSYNPGVLSTTFLPGGSSQGASGSSTPSGGQANSGAMAGFGSVGASGGLGSGGSGGSLGAGKSSGSGGSAGDKLVGESAGSAAKGTPGAGGKPGAPIGGAGAKKGEGAKDEEHQRKYVMDDDDAFQLTDEAGETVVDPVTGFPVVPPVIGI